MTDFMLAEALVEIYRSLYRIRRVEEEIVRIYPSDKIKSPVHLSIGQESVSVGVCAALNPEDVTFGTYRGHALYLAKGGDMRQMWAELYGKSGGSSRGKAGSMHLADIPAGMMGTSAIVGTTIPQAVGYALALKMLARSAVVAVFFGDGATEEGVFYESLNFAALKRLPILFICENNLYSVYSRIEKRMASPDIRSRAETLGVPAMRIEDGATTAIFEEGVRAISAIRSGFGPRLLECMTYRWRDHVGPDEDRSLGYRPEKEIDKWIAEDQLVHVANRIDAATRGSIEREIETEIAVAIAYAEAAPFPDDSELANHVFRA